MSGQPQSGCWSMLWDHFSAMYNIKINVCIVQVAASKVLFCTLVIVLLSLLWFEFTVDFKMIWIYVQWSTDRIFHDTWCQYSYIVMIDVCNVELGYGDVGDLLYIGARWLFIGLLISFFSLQIKKKPLTLSRYHTMTRCSRQSQLIYYLRRHYLGQRHCLGHSKHSFSALKNG